MWTRILLGIYQTLNDHRMVLAARTHTEVGAHWAVSFFAVALPQLQATVSAFPL